MTLTLEQSQKEFIATVYQIDGDDNYKPIAIVVSDKDFIDDYQVGDDQAINAGLPNDPNFNWEACGYSGLDVIDLDEQDDD